MVANSVDLMAEWKVFERVGKKAERKVVYLVGSTAGMTDEWLVV